MEELLQTMLSFVDHNLVGSGFIVVEGGAALQLNWAGPHSYPVY